MSRRTFTPKQVKDLKREAKKLARAEGTKHGTGLDKIAAREGYADWWQLQRASSKKFPAEIDVPNYGPMPLVEATPSDDGLQVVVLCPYCGQRHAHGPAEGSRRSECDGGGEYYVRLQGVAGPALPQGQSREVVLPPRSSAVSANPREFGEGRSKYTLPRMIELHGPCRSQIQPGPAFLFGCILWDGHEEAHRRFGKTWNDANGYMPSDADIEALEQQEEEVNFAEFGIVGNSDAD